MFFVSIWLSITSLLHDLCKHYALGYPDAVAAVQRLTPHLPAMLKLDRCDWSFHNIDVSCFLFFNLWISIGMQAHMITKIITTVTYTKIQKVRLFGFAFSPSPSLSLLWSSAAAAVVLPTLKPRKLQLDAWYRATRIRCSKQIINTTKLVWLRWNLIDYS